VITAELPRPALRPAGFATRLRRFADNVFEPRLHAAFAALWSVSLLGNLHAVEGAAAWRFSARTAVLVVSVFLCLFFLRMVDEIKDLDYDRVYNPGRPLVSGLVTRADITAYLALFAAIVIGLNAMLGVALAAWLALDLGYGLLQLPLERAARPVRENLFVNLVTVYPVNVALSVYTLLFFLADSGARFHARDAWLVVAYACAFLHFELARKSGWPRLAGAGERLYSQLVGLGGSLALASGFALAALGIVLWLFAPWAQTGGLALTGWLPVLVLVPAGWGLVAFARNRERRHAARPPAVAFLFTFYVTMLVHALAATPLAWGGR
jgi:hypothetical protein